MLQSHNLRLPAGANISHNLPHRKRSQGLEDDTGAATAQPTRVNAAVNLANCRSHYLVVNVAHGEVLLVTGTGHADVLQPVPSSALAGINAEFLISQVISNLQKNKRKKHMGHLISNSRCRKKKERRIICSADFATRNSKARAGWQVTLIDTSGRAKAALQP